jgi:hypothetical protein
MGLPCMHAIDDTTSLSMLHAGLIVHAMKRAFASHPIPSQIRSPLRSDPLSDPIPSRISISPLKPISSVSTHCIITLGGVAHTSGPCPVRLVVLRQVPRVLPSVLRHEQEGVTCVFVCTSAPRPLSLALIFTFPQPAIPPASLMTGPEAPIGPLPTAVPPNQVRRCTSRLHERARQGK